jgi:hypothetical protein
MKGTHVIAVALTCVVWASTVAAQAPEPAQAPEYFRARQQELREQRTTAKAQGQAQAKADAEVEKQTNAQARGRAARGGPRAGQAEASETFTRVVRLEPGATFDLRNAVGDVTITGGSGREGKIEVVKRVRALNTGRAQQVLSQLRVEIAERGGNAEVRTIPPIGRGPAEARVDYVVTLPANVNVMLRSTSGNMRLQNMSGDELNVDTLQGNVTASDVQSRLLELHSVLGDMTLENIASRRAFVQTMRGNVEYAGPLQRTGQYRIQTHTGNIRMRIPPGGPGFDLDAMTNKGDLQSDFALRLPQPLRARRPATPKILRGPVGEAGAMLTTYSFSGDILIIRREGQ